MSASFIPQKAIAQQRPASMKRPAKPGTTTPHQQQQQKQQEQAKPQLKKQQLVSATQKQRRQQQQQMQSASPQAGWRSELFFKSPEELSRQLPFLRQATTKHDHFLTTIAHGFALL
jgi:hypothetical protein